MTAFLTSYPSIYIYSISQKKMKPHSSTDHKTVSYFSLVLSSAGVNKWWKPVQLMSVTPVHCTQNNSWTHSCTVIQTVRYWPNTWYPSTQVYVAQLMSLHSDRFLISLQPFGTSPENTQSLLHTIILLQLQHYNTTTYSTISTEAESIKISQSGKRHWKQSGVLAFSDMKLR